MKMYRLITLLAIAFLLLGCSKKEETPKPKPAPTEMQPQDYKGVVGISKIIAHPALDAIELGLQDELKAQGFTNITFDLQSANGDISTASSIAKRFKSDNVLVAVGIATPMALSLANSIKDIPIVFSAVTDPVDAGLRTNITKENTNITGVSDMTPVKEQVELATKLLTVKKLGFIYNPSETNSLVLLKLTEEACKSFGITLITQTVTNTAEVKQATEVLAPKVDVIYASTDNVVYASLSSLIPTAAKYKVPVIAAVPDNNPESGSLASYGVDYYKSGRETGKMVINIIKGAKPGDIPVKYVTDPQELGLFINETVAKNMGIVVPVDLLKASDPYPKK